ncbi:biotin-dependent carboxylase-like uncharacterized protein [Propioniferax innocua]|uniref:Biotin-dependent carboxylase-like uncharacterized protein n=2 Tax=Propioniferax innocua TaxID=1753 RepID=A0A542ZD08_9ACTN|nr:biotin-dependent carboxylase-like uncharacterized protein [Propioniferax innocua]
MSTMPTTMEVVHPGPIATFQDLGRHGVMGLGIPVSGALDERSHRLANRLVGNPETHPTVEATLGGLAVRFSGPVVVAVTGADVDVFVGDRQEAINCVLRVPRGTTLRLGAPRSGLRSYVAVSGLFSLPTLFDSSSTDLLSGLGPEPLQAGDRIDLRRPDPGAVNPAAISFAPVSVPTSHVICLVHPGPRRDWLTQSAWETLVSQEFCVSPRSNRIGVRLEGPTLERRRHEELRSEGLITGAIQVPGDGRPVVFMHDHPTTGGYPVIGLVRAEDLHLMGQLAPGDTVAFRPA